MSSLGMLSEAGRSRLRGVASAITALCLVALMGVLAAPPSAVAAKQEITVAFGVDPTNLNPLASTSIPGRSMINHVFDKLLWFDEDGNLVPKLAESWSYPQPNVLQLKLRKGVKWHDGSDFTAEDVKFTIDSIRKPPKPTWQTASFEPISDVKVVDPHTVQIITPEPNRVILRVLTLVEVVSKSVFTTQGAAVATKPVGTGPFRFVEYLPGQRLVVAANPTYWGGAPTLQRVTFRFIPEAGTRMAALQSGEVDFIDNVPVDQMDAVKRNAQLKLLAGPSLRIMYVAFRSQRTPFNDLRVRQAGQHAINKESIVRDLLGGTTTVAHTPVAPQMPGYNAEIRSLPHDPQRARQLLQEAGAAGKRIVFGYPNGRYLMDKQVGEATAGFLTAAGFQVAQESPEWGIFFTDIRKGIESRFDAYLAGWGGDTGDPTWFLWEHFYSPASARLSGVKSEKIDQLLREAMRTLDEKKAMEMYRQVQVLAMAESSLIPLYPQPNIWAIRRNLGGFTMRPDEFVLFHKVRVAD